MELDEDDIKFLTEEEQKIIRNYQNSKLNVYQTPERNYFFKLKSDYNKSYEHREIQNNSIIYLTSPSNFIYYTIGTECNSIYEAEREIKNNFNNIYKASINTKNEDQLKKQIKEIKCKIVEHRFIDNEEYKKLCDLINDEEFDKKMKEDYDFRNSIILNQFFQFHNKCEEILNKYSNLLTPFICNSIKEQIENKIDDYF